LRGSGHAEGTTQSAVADGAITIRDQANQQQNVADLSRDVENANDAISPIFNKEKEQNRLQTVQLMGEIGSQVSDIVKTQGELNALQKAKEKYGELPANATEEKRQQWLDQLKNSPEYKDELAKSGTGSDLQRGIQAATAALTGLAGGNMNAALAGAAAPYLAEQVKKQVGEDNIAANAIAHAIVGGVVAELSGGNGLAGAAGAASGELAARALMAEMYPGKTASQLSEEEKQKISALATLAAGLAGGLSGDNTASALAGAQTGKNAVENNSLSVDQNQDRIKELTQCQGNLGCETGVTEKYKKLNADQHKSVVECKGARACVDKANEVGGLQTAYANRLGELGDKLHNTGNLTPEEKQEWAYLQAVLPQLEADRNAAIHNALMSGDSSEAKQLAVNSLAQTIGTSAAGIAAGINKGGKYQPNQGAVGNMNEFLKQPGFGSDVKNTAQKSSQQYQGQSVYKATGDIGDYIKKGDQFYLDGQHKNHIEVFDKRGNFRVVLNLDGTINESKTKDAEGRKLK